MPNKRRGHAGVWSRYEVSLNDPTNRGPLTDRALITAVPASDAPSGPPREHRTGYSSYSESSSAGSRIIRRCETPPWFTQSSARSWTRR